MTLAYDYYCYPGEYDSATDGILYIFGIYILICVIATVVFLIILCMCIRWCMGLPVCPCCGGNKVTTVYQMVDDQPPNLDPYANQV